MVDLYNEEKTIKFLLDFEEEIADIYSRGRIKSPVHLDGSKDYSLERNLIRLFRDNNIDKNNWLVCTHRSHYFWLLSGRSPEELKKQILENHSMNIMDDRFLTTSIVGGGAPIAVGIAWALKMKKSKNKVWCILGDAAYECGIVYESIKYSERHDLPIIFIVTDNQLCVNANTQDIWGKENTKKVIRISYKRHFPHAGSNKYTMF